MSELRKATTDHPYFITLSIAGWIDLFTRERYCNILIDSLKYCMENKGLRVFEYVVMPSHVHLIAQNLVSNLPDVIRDLKSFTAKEFLKAMEEPGESRKEWLTYMFRYFANGTRQNKEFMVWTKTNYPIELSDNDMYDQKAKYIEMNLVSAGLVTDESAWKYSSAGTFAPLKLTEDGGVA